MTSTAVRSPARRASEPRRRSNLADAARERREPAASEREVRGGAELVRVLLRRSQPRDEVGLPWQFREMLVKLHDEVTPLAPRQVPQRQLDLAEVLVGGHRQLSFFL